MGDVLYVDVDPIKCKWTEELIKRDLIAPGEVWCRDIRDIRPDEISEFIQFHAFNGIAVWSYALRLAGWPDDRKVWTGSCPCQSFSKAGRRKGFADERHLWPAWFHLISQCRPDVVFGEQVESDDSKAWLDLVWTDLEALGFAFGPVVFPAAGVGAPHMRHRIYWVANARGQQRQRWKDQQRSACPLETERNKEGIDAQRSRPDRRDDFYWVAESSSQRWDGWGAGGMANSNGQRFSRRPESDSKEIKSEEPASRRSNSSGCSRYDEMADSRGQSGPLNGFWRVADWLFCRDGKWRPVRSGSFPLAVRSPARVLRLRGYGDGLCAPATEAFIRAYMNHVQEMQD